MSDSARQVHVDDKTLRSFCHDVFAACGLSDENAGHAARLLVRSSLRGIDTHGVAFVRRYVTQLRSGAADPNAALTVRRDDEGPCLALDANYGFGAVQAYHAVQRTVANAQEYGVGATTLRHNNHCGAAENYVLEALDGGRFLAMVVLNSDASMAPVGGKTKLLGTNPIAFGAPVHERYPVVMDFATSVVARNKIIRAMRAGRPIPAGWALDADGQPTTDAEAAFDGFVVPIGGHKGYGLALMITTLAGVLSGGRLDIDIPSITRQPTDPQGGGQFFLVVDIERFLPLEDFTARMAELVTLIAAAEPVAPDVPVLLPGQREYETAKVRAREGIPIPAEVLADLRAAADECGVPRLAL